MAAYKLGGRVEEPRWDPPLLTFIIERHGGTVLGSSLAELQHWQIDTESNRAEIIKEGYRQLSPQQPRWKQAEADEEASKVASLILNRQEHDLVSWLKNGNVKVAVAQIVPDDAAKQTVIGRRKRFWKSLDKKLETSWSRTGNIYRKVDG
jgi:hypothetical protein